MEDKILGCAPVPAHLAADCLPRRVDETDWTAGTDGDGAIRTCVV